MNGLSRLRAGFSLVEVLIAMTIFAVIFGSAMAMMGEEVRSFSRAAEAASAAQNERYAVDQIARGFRAAGVDLTGGQPMLVYASSDAVAFNGDYVSNTPNDLDAIFQDTMVSDAASMALGKSQRMLVPTSGFYYPDTTYGASAPAETITFFFQPDSSGPAGSYILFRQSNGQPPEVVALGLQRNGSEPFFRYIRLVAGPAIASRMDSVPPAQLPLAHVAPIHESRGDTARFALIDSIRAVRVSFVATSAAGTAREVRRVVSRLIRLPNAGLQAFQTCGNEPPAPPSVQVQLADVNGSMVPELRWTPSPDETGGEQDVVRYVVYRQEGVGAAWGDAFFKLPASGAGSYVWDDTRVVSGQQYSYAVAAEDCTPRVGSPLGGGSVTIP